MSWNETADPSGVRPNGAKQPCTCSGWLLSGIPLKTKGGLLLAQTVQLFRCVKFDYGYVGDWLKIMLIPIYYKYPQKRIIYKFYLRTQIFPSMYKSIELSNLYGYDQWLVNRFTQFIPDIKGLLARMDKPAQKYIRVNTLKIASNTLKERLLSKGFVLRDTILRDVFAVQESPYPLGASIEYLLGYYYIQDLSSCLAVEALDVQEEHVILDMTSAPGGKTTLIAQKMKNRGSIIALESNLNRINSILFNTFRCGVFNTLIYRMDARQVADLKIGFDRVLLDAPCSCEGIIAKDAARKTSRQPSDIEYCSSRQKILIEAGIKVVKPGGILVYCDLFLCSRGERGDNKLRVG